MHRRLVLLPTLLLALAACGGSATPEASLTDPTTGVDVGAATGDPTAPAAPATAGPMTERPSDAPPLPAGLCPEDDPGCSEAPSDGGAAGSACLVGATECADDPSGGVDQARPVIVVDALGELASMPRGEDLEATGAPIEEAVVDGRTLTLQVAAPSCHELQDVVVVASPAEVRLLVLTGSRGTCDSSPVPQQVTVELDEPLGDRELLDLAG